MLTCPSTGSRASRRLPEHLGTCDKFRQQAELGRASRHATKRRLREYPRLVRSSAVRKHRVDHWVGRCYICQGRHYGFHERYVDRHGEIPRTLADTRQMGYDVFISLVLVKGLTDFRKVHEHGRYNLRRVAGVLVYQSSRRKVPFGARFSLSGRQSGPRWILRPRYR